MTAPLQNLLISVNVFPLEKVSFSDTQNRNSVWDNLTQPIQIQLSQKQKICSELFFAFLQSILNFKPLPKKDDPQSCCISGNQSSEQYG